jgi:glycerol uptake facilitator-like aquaporin
MQNHLPAKLLAEFIGTFAFVFIGAAPRPWSALVPGSTASQRLPSPMG